MRTSGTVIVAVSITGSMMSPRMKHVGKRVAHEFADAQHALGRLCVFVLSGHGVTKGSMRNGQQQGRVSRLLPAQSFAKDYSVRVTVSTR